MTDSSVPDISVLLADDHALMRESFRALLDATPGLAPVGEAGNGVEAVRLARQLRPDVVLMDVRMPEMDGIEATRQICSAPETSTVRVLILTTFDLDEYVYAALQAGASGFLVKDSTAAELLNGIRLVAAGEALLAPRVTRRLIDAFTKQIRPLPGTPHGLDTITEREREVLTLIAGGLSNTEIAQHLHLGMGTVKTHIGRLLHKLAARDRAQLVIAAYESGLVTAQGTRS
ncbi:DNA-binding NarL/FixJ family response regulator [Actinoplanes campanulatus]|uniref:DNA-binding NarL/FixJ family response regulator n=1 Tax=Actinoplanes campanulatus TaxID=113559 RepID=A0A7W5AS22_9ACTN|nr:response regulator transcription factor [Actinoplanes campanulatus]MBB3101235.1 DNA-binding NarL/FixJ family response regulator [Actinoplanes campanulatus]GGN51311.1 DNA-binding response regulator [Actinoplanes campanulatus]GID42117.1 DNA-binding response regulator [Actinoplanes campanulatus]